MIGVGAVGGGGGREGFFFNDTATTEIYTLSLHDALPICQEVESLGATFIEVESEESGDAAGGYAKEMSDDYKRRQGELVHETLKKQDIVITTALIPGRPAPTLITAAMVADMKPGSVIVDMAVASGGNCELSDGEGEVIAHGVTRSEERRVGKGCRSRRSPDH